jgi:hypothetical protein
MERHAAHPPARQEHAQVKYLDGIQDFMYDRSGKSILSFPFTFPKFLYRPMSNLFNLLKVEPHKLLTIKLIFRNSQ